MEEKFREYLLEKMSVAFDIGYAAGFEYATQKNVVSSEKVEDAIKDYEIEKKRKELNEILGIKNGQ